MKGNSGRWIALGVISLGFLGLARQATPADTQVLSNTERPPNTESQFGSASPSNTESLVGLWRAERVFPPAGPVRVILTRDDGGLVAHVRGVRVPVEEDNGELRFSLPHDGGGFRGRLANDSSVISGHWIGKRTVNFYGFATPMDLPRTRPGTWDGSVQTLQNRFSLYIPISESDDGGFQAFLRNPERNQGVFTRFNFVEREGNRIQFLDADHEPVISAAYDEETDRFSMNMPWRGGTYDFTRVERHDAPGFYPRADTGRYQHATPPDLGDGWSVGEPTSVGLETSRLNQFVQHILDTRTESLRTPYIQSLLVARRGQLVLEEYFYGFHRDRPHDLRSAAKSITGTMVGVAMEESEDWDARTPAYSFFNDPVANPDPRKDRITVEHLLTMRGGYACDDNDYESPGNEDRMQDQTDQLDWYRYTLDLPMAREPGTEGVYCTGGINLLGGIVSGSSGEWLPAFFHTRVAEPLQIRTYHMNLDPLERGYAGGGIYMRPRDFLKFGQMVLDGGTWNGRRMVSEDWIQRSLQSHAGVNRPDDYGYTWWLDDLPYAGGTVRAYSATGNGGQLLILVPELDLVVGMNGGNYGDFQTWIKWRDTLVPEYVLDAVTN